MKNFKRFITLALALVMVLSMSSVAFASEVETAPEMPTATATEIQANGYTLAMNFEAVEPTAEQLAYYGDWAADFVLTFKNMTSESVTLNANGEADGWLGGQYDAWSASWVNVPFEDVTLVNEQKLQIMKYATTNVANYTGTTYKDIVNTVKDFDCGLYLTPEFLAANEGMTVTLELVVQENANSEPVRIGNPYVFEATKPALPTATVKEIAVEDLTFAMNFVADAVTEAQLDYYGDWAADFVLTLNKDVEFDGTTNYLAGQYDKHSEDWITVPTKIGATAGQEIKIMQYLGSLMGSMEAVTYEYVVEGVKDFDCGVHFDADYLKKNDGLVATLELRLYVPNSTDYYVIGDTYTFTVSSAVDEEGKSGSITDLLDKADTAEGGTVTVTSNATTAKVDVGENVTLNLNGNTLEATKTIVYGAITDSTNGQALLKVDRLDFVDENKQVQLPVYDTEAQGYRFFTVEKIQHARLENGKYAFQPLFNETAKNLLKAGTERTGVKMRVYVTWDNEGGQPGSTYFDYTNDQVAKYLDSYTSEGVYGQMFTLTINNYTQLSNLKFSAVVESSTGFDMATAQINAVEAN